MKILITTDTYFPVINGVVISTYNLYTELKNMGHEVKILTLDQNGRERVEGDVYYLKSVSTKIYPGARIGNPFCSNIIKKLIQWKPEIIHSQTEFTTFVAAKMIRKKLKIPEIHTYHTMYEDCLHYIKIGKKISKVASIKLIARILNSMDLVVTPTKKVEDLLISYGMKVRTCIIPSGIDLSKFNHKINEKEKELIFNKHNIPKEGKKLIYVGRVAKEKNLEELIDFYSEICIDKDFIFIIVGDGPYLDKLKEKINRLNISNKIFFTGMIENNNVYKYYQLGDVFINGSICETQGLTYIEALASGVPILCRYDKCNENLIMDGFNGYKYNNKKEFEMYLNSMTLDEDVLKSFKENALNNIDKYSSYNFMRNIENVYKKVIMG